MSSLSDRSSRRLLYSPRLLLRSPAVAFPRVRLHHLGFGLGFLGSEGDCLRGVDATFGVLALYILRAM